MEELLAESNFSLNVEGAIVEGIITEIRQNEVVVDIGGKSEGVIPAHEFLDLGDLQVGSTIEVLVEKVEDKGGNPVVSYDKGQQKKNWRILSRILWFLTDPKPPIKNGPNIICIPMFMRFST